MRITIKHNEIHLYAKWRHDHEEEEKERHLCVLVELVLAMFSISLFCSSFSENTSDELPDELSNFLFLSFLLIRGVRISVSSASSGTRL